MWVTVFIALLAGALTLLLPAPATGNAAAFHSSVLQSVMITVIQIGAASLFLWSLKDFKHELRVAYGIICVGLVMLGFSNLQLPIITYFDLVKGFYVASGIIVIPYIAPALLVYIGERLFAKLFNIKSIWMSFWFVASLASVSAAVAVFGAKAVAASGSENYTATIAISAWTAIFLLASALIVRNILRVAGPVYRDALRWLVGARIVVTITGFSYTLMLIFFGDQNTFNEYGVVLLPSVVSAILFLRSGYAFKLINEDHTEHTPKQKVTVVDAITFAASQASNPLEIDHTLDTLRIITSTTTAGADGLILTPEQKESLKQVYADVEQYLVEKEPIRRLTAEEIRRKGAAYFGIDYASFVALVTRTPSAQ